MDCYSERAYSRSFYTPFYSIPDSGSGSFGFALFERDGDARFRRKIFCPKTRLIGSRWGYCRPR